MNASTSTSTPAPRKDNWALLPKRVLLGALCMDLFFAIAYSLTIWLPPTPTNKPLTFLFDLNGEGNVSAWWQGSQLLLVALGFFALALWFFQSDERVAPLRRLFFVGGLAFAYLSADEIGQVHENTSQLLQSWHWLNQVETKALAALGKKMHRLHGGSLWIPIFAIIGIALIWWLWPQLRLAWKLWHRQILLLAAGFGLLVFAAAVLESIGDLLPAGVAGVRMIEVGVEETLESIGSSIVLYSVVSVLAQAGAGVLPGSARRADVPAETPEAHAE